MKKIKKLLALLVITGALWGVLHAAAEGGGGESIDEVESEHYGDDSLFVVAIDKEEALVLFFKELEVSCYSDPENRMINESNRREIQGCIDKVGYSKMLWQPFCNAVHIIPAPERIVGEGLVLTGEGSRRDHAEQRFEAIKILCEIPRQLMIDFAKCIKALSDSRMDPGSLGQTMADVRCYLVCKEAHKHKLFYASLNDISSCRKFLKSLTKEYPSLSKVYGWDRYKVIRHIIQISYDSMGTTNFWPGNPFYLRAWHEKNSFVVRARILALSGRAQFEEGADPVIAWLSVKAPLWVVVMVVHLLRIEMEEPTG